MMRRYSVFTRQRTLFGLSDKVKWDYGMRSEKCITNFSRKRKGRK
jgi:hypothetical protein